MPIAIACPSCGHKGQVPDHYAGLKVRCRQCGTTFAAGVSKGTQDEETALLSEEELLEVEEEQASEEDSSL